MPRGKSARTLIDEADRLTKLVDNLWIDLSRRVNDSKPFNEDEMEALKENLEAFNQLAGSASGVQFLMEVLLGLHDNSGWIPADATIERG